MKKKLLLLSGLVLFSSVIAAEEMELETIQVESSTIQDISGSNKREVSAVNHISEKKYQTINPKNINEVLRTVPGITADVRSGDIVEIHMRGVGQQEFMWENTGVAVVIDGVPVLQNGGKVKLNLNNIESIKVIKGGASYLYGADALAGAVIITTKKPKDQDEITLYAEYGSYAYQNYETSIFTSNDTYAATVNISHRFTNGYWDMGENKSNAINAKLTYFINDSSDITAGIEITDKYEESSRGSVTGVTAAKENPTGAGDGDLPWNHDYNSDIQKYFLIYNKDFSSNSNLMVNTYYYIDNYDYEASPHDTTGDTLDDRYTRDSTEDIDQYGVKSEFRSTLNNLGYMIGLDLGQRKLDETDITSVTYEDGRSSGTLGDTSIADSTQDRYAIYGETKYKLSSDLTAVLNARYDYDKYEYEQNALEFDGLAWQTTNTYHEDTFKNISLRAGAAYQLDNKNTLFSSVSTGFRNPRVYEMYANDFDPDRYSDNNPDIDTQTTINYELGIRGDQKIADTNVKYELSVYQLNTKDIIAKNAGTYYSNGNVFFDNVGDSRSRGIELSLNTDKTRLLSFDVAYTYMRAKYTAHDPFTVDLSPTYKEDGDKTYDISSNTIPRTPQHRFDLFTYLKINKDWSIVAENYAQSNYYADETNLVTMPGYMVMNLQLRYNTKIQNNKLELFVRTDNVFDNQYYRTVYLYSDRSGNGELDSEDASITVDPGRVFYVGAKYSF